MTDIELKKKCTEIYYNHKPELDLLYNLEKDVIRRKKNAKNALVELKELKNILKTSRPKDIPIIKKRITLQENLLNDLDKILKKQKTPKKQKKLSNNDKNVLLEKLLDDTKSPNKSKQWNDNLKWWLDDLNILKILNISNAEIRHSSFLSWLIDPNGSHSIEIHEKGDILKGLIELAITKDNEANTADPNRKNCSKCNCDVRNILKDPSFIAFESIEEIPVGDEELKVRPYRNKYWCGECAKKVSEKYPYKDISTIDTKSIKYNDFRYLREKDNIDMRFVSDENKIMICIENKVGSKEGAGQTSRYRKMLLDVYKEDYRKIFIYLTVEGYEARDSENWIPVKYEELVDIIDKTVTPNGSSKISIEDKAKTYIDDYLKETKRITYHTEFLNICTETYKEHGQAIDIINEYMFKFQDLMYEQIKNKFANSETSNIDSNYYPDYTGKSNIWFNTCNSKKLTLYKVINPNGFNFSYQIDNRQTELTIKAVMNKHENIDDGEINKFIEVWKAYNKDKIGTPQLQKKLKELPDKIKEHKGGIYDLFGSGWKIIPNYDELNILEWLDEDKKKLGVYEIAQERIDEIFSDIMAYVKDFEDKILSAV